MDNINQSIQCIFSYEALLVWACHFEYNLGFVWPAKKESKGGMSDVVTLIVYFAAKLGPLSFGKMQQQLLPRRCCYLCRPCFLLYFMSLIFIHQIQILLGPFCNLCGLLNLTHLDSSICIGWPLLNFSLRPLFCKYFRTQPCMHLPNLLKKIKNIYIF